MHNTDQILIDFIRLARLVHRESHRHIRDIDDHRLHRGQGHLLSLISENPGAKQIDLAEMMDMRPSSMTEYLVKLDQAGLVGRKHDENDQRVIRVYITDKGKEILEKAAGSMSEMTESVFGVLSADEKEQFHATIKKLTESLDKDFSDDFRRGGCGDHHGCHPHHHGHGGHDRFYHGFHHDSFFREG